MRFFLFDFPVLFINYDKDGGTTLVYIVTNLARKLREQHSLLRTIIGLHAGDMSQKPILHREPALIKASYGNSYS
jgi:hypothetical protein